MRTRDRHRSGFTLMEATVALGVFTIGMLGLAASFSQIVHANTAARHKQIAILLAERKLAEFRIAKAGEPVSTSGTFGTPFDGYTWEAWFSSQSEDLPMADVWVEVKHSSGAGVRLWSRMEMSDDI
jgi:type II secretion system protein I